MQTAKSTPVPSGEVAGFSKVWVNASYEGGQTKPASPQPQSTPKSPSLSQRVFVDGADDRAKKDLYVQEDKMMVRSESRRSTRTSQHFSPNSSLNSKQRRGAGAAEPPPPPPAAPLDPQSVLNSTQSSRASSGAVADAAVASAAVPGTPRVGNWTDTAPPAEPKRSARWVEPDDGDSDAADAPNAEPPLEAPRPDDARAKNHAARNAYTPAALYEIDVSASVATCALAGRAAALSRPAPGAAAGAPLVRCIIERTKPVFGKPFYELRLERCGSFLLAARPRVKSKASSYIISQDRDDTTRSSAGCVAKLKANLVGSEYVLWRKSEHVLEAAEEQQQQQHTRGGPPRRMRPPAKSDFCEAMAIDFKPTASKAKGGPRVMRVALPEPDQHGAGSGGRTAPPDGLQGLLSHAKRAELPSHLEDRLSVLHNRSPVWDEAARGYTLNFAGRRAAPSVKNFQLVQWDFNRGAHGADVLLQFCKLRDGQYALDFAYPMSATAAFAVALSSLDTKLCYAM